MFSRKKIVFVFLLLSTMLILIRSSWIGDDAYITMRTVDNFIHGYGLTWNPGERVQSFTHPLWLWMLILVYAFLPKISFAYFAILIISLMCSIAVFWIMLQMFSDKTFVMFVLWILLVSSRAFLDYSTSGLENPASHLLAIIFFGVFLKHFHNLDTKKSLFLYTIAGLITLNRMDQILLFLPALIYMFLRTTKRTWVLLPVGFLPFILWEIFSLMYYGFLLPNTAYAKLNTSIPLYLYLKQGLLYYINSLRWDPITLFVIGAALCLAFASGKVVDKLMAGGICLYLLYIFYIGGDFMSGRFFSTVFLIAATIVISYLPSLLPREQFIFLFLVIAFGFAGTSPVFWDWRADNNQMKALAGGDVAGIGDQRQLWYGDSNLMNLNRYSIFPSHIAVDAGLEMKKIGGVFVEVQIGYLGFFAGPDVYLIDEYALTDPLLARLPIPDIYSWRIGHFSRAIPDGYVETIESGKNLISNAELASYYDQIKLIVSGDIWSWERLKAIWRMNTGQYDYLIESYTSPAGKSDW